MPSYGGANTKKTRAEPSGFTTAVTRHEPFGERSFGSVSILDVDAARLLAKCVYIEVASSSRTTPRHSPSAQNTSKPPFTNATRGFSPAREEMTASRLKVCAAMLRFYNSEPRQVPS